MAAEIQVLPQTLINKIAAGEVIVRPASVVKELVENAYDAQARHIRVEVSKDCRSISVVDDGLGMDETNARRSLLRNATSKIRDFDDLEALLTRGFRGEALASIVSVSRFEMLTRERGALAGVRLTASGGRIDNCEAVGTAEGTSIHVRDLFYNTPARLKFLKSPGAEYNAIVQLLTQQALSHPDVGLTLQREGKARFDLPPGQDLRHRCEELLGAELHGRLVAVDFERDGLTVSGFAARPEASRKDRRWQYLMVNGRPISAKPLSHPLQEAYRGLLMVGRFPVVVLDIRLDPALVDVNVHPTKEEVRFENERKVGGLLYRAVQEALRGEQLIPSMELDGEARPAPPEPVPTRPPAEDPSLPFVFSPKGATPLPRPAPRQDNQLFPARDFLPQAPPREGPEALPFGNQTTDASPPRCEGPPPQRPSLEPPPPGTLALGDGAPPAVLGQVARTYILAEWGDDLLLIDQHAAHERLVYLQLRRARSEAPASQPLMLPHELQLAPEDAEEIEPLLPLLAELGFDIRPGERPGHYAVHALPADNDTLDPRALVLDLLDELRQSGQDAPDIDERREQILIRTACHSAIRAGQALHREEMQALIAQMNAERLSFTCPHGRPTMVRLTKAQLDRQFGRLG